MTFTVFYVVRYCNSVMLLRLRVSTTIEIGRLKQHETQNYETQNYSFSKITIARHCICSKNKSCT